MKLFPVSVDAVFLLPLAVVGLLGASAGSASFASVATPVPALSLSSHQREQLRYRLENLFNEVDLLIRNRRSDEADVRRQEMEFKVLKVFERIPFDDDLSELTREVKQTAEGHRLRVEEVKLVSRSPTPSPLPQMIFTDNRRFEISQDQLVEKLRLGFRVHGDRNDLQKWVESWKTENLRIITLDPDIKEARSQIRDLNNQGEVWEVRAVAYRFRNLKYPRLEPRDPLELLPKWARVKPQLFAQKEPLLWSFVDRFHKMKPQALPLYQNREKFLLNDARMGFFIHASAPDDVKQLPPRHREAQPPRTN